MTNLELAWCRYLWDNAVTKETIRRQLGWGWRKLDKILKCYEFPIRPPGTARHEFKNVEEFIIEYADCPVLKVGESHLERYIDYYQLKDLERIKDDEFRRSMMLTDFMHDIVMGVLKIVGTTSEEIVAFKDHKPLSKKMRIIYKVHIILLKILDHRCRVVGLYGGNGTKKKNLSSEKNLFGCEGKGDIPFPEWYEDKLQDALRLLDFKISPKKR